jgi:hypothetical protein
MNAEEMFLEDLLQSFFLCFEPWGGERPFPENKQPKLVNIFMWEVQPFTPSPDTWKNDRHQNMQISL